MYTLFICIINMCILLQDVLFWLELFFLYFICQNKIIFISYDLFLYTSLCSGGRGMLRGGEKKLTLSNDGDKRKESAFFIFFAVVSIVFVILPSSWLLFPVIGLVN